MTMHTAVRSWAGVLALSVLLTGCGLFGDDDDVDIRGNRLSVLQLTERLSVDRSAERRDMRLPPAQNNPFWPQTGGLPHHVMGHMTLGSDLRQVWSRSIGAGGSRAERVSAQPVSVGNRIYAVDAEGVVVALDKETGDSLWRTSIVPEGERRESLSAGLAFAAGTLFASAGFSEVVALDPATGSRLWTRPTGAPVRGGLAATAETVFAMTTDNELLAMTAGEGAPLWRHAGIPEEEGVLGAASPAVGEGIVVAAYSSGEVFGLRVENGALAWQDNLAAVRRIGADWRLSDIRAMPVIDDGRTYVVSLSSRMVAIDQRTGARVWQRELGSLDMPAVVGDIILVVTTENQLVAIFKDTGQIRWIRQLRRFEDRRDREGAVIWTAPLMAGGRLILFNSEEDVVEVDPADGTILREWDISDPPAASPIVVDNTLYLLTENGALTAYR